MKNKIFACICLLVIAVVGVMTIKQYIFPENKDEDNATIEKSNSDTLQMELMAYLHATNQFRSLTLCMWIIRKVYCTERVRLMKKTKKVLAMLLAVLLLVSQNRMASAEELPTEAIYDLEQGGTQSFWVQDANGEIGEIVIREVRGTSRVKDGSYEVSYDHTGYWEAGFCVKIGNNKITSAYSPFHSVYSGKITQARLTKNSTSKASYLFIYQQAILSYNAGVLASGENDHSESGETNQFQSHQNSQCTNPTPFLS